MELPFLNKKKYVYNPIGKKTIPHTKMLPQCRNVTKQNCVTLWETDPNGKQVHIFFILAVPLNLITITRQSRKSKLQQNRFLDSNPIGSCDLRQIRIREFLDQIRILIRILPNKNDT
jgi:hypothetical protein